MKFINYIKKLRHEIYIAHFRRLPLCNNKIILWANSFKQYGCSPKYITEYILKEYPGVFDIVWVFEYGAVIPEALKDKVRIVYYFSIDYLRELHTAKFIICNMRTGSSHYWKKRDGQMYIQTWHSSLRLKKIEGDAEEFLPYEYICNSKNDSKKIDLLVSGCEFSTKIFERAFWYDGHILKSGTPRCDIFFGDTETTKNKVFKFYNIPKGNRLVLYAPTFRTNKDSDFLKMNFDRLKNALGENWTIGARLHPNVLNDADAQGAVSMSKYPDMQELIAAADILITDFSSCMFDMMIAKKPCILYAEDFDEYIQTERELYFDIMTLPFPLAKNMDELCKCIQNFDCDRYHDDIQEFIEQTGSYEEGKAAERVCEYILENM